MPIVVEVYNNGSVDFSGVLFCTFEENEIYTINRSLRWTQLLKMLPLL